MGKAVLKGSMDVAATIRAIKGSKAPDVHYLSQSETPIDHCAAGAADLLKVNPHSKTAVAQIRPTLDTFGTSGPHTA